MTLLSPSPCITEGIVCQCLMNSCQLEGVNLLLVLHWLGHDFQEDVLHKLVETN